MVRSRHIRSRPLQTPETHARIGALAAVSLAFEVFGPIDGDAVVDDEVCRAEVLVDDFADDGPAVGVLGAFGLVFEVGEHAFAVFFDGLDVAEEGVALGGEDRGG